MIEIYAEYINKETIIVVIGIAVWMILCAIAHNLYGDGE